MLYLREYNNTTIIDNDIEEIIINKLYSPLDNLPPSVNKITIGKSINIYRRQNKIPYNCKLIIENVIINNYGIFNNIKEEDYLDITELYLSGNQITNIPKSIWSLINLKELYLSYNQITSISESIGSLINLQDLYLCNNQITSIPESIGLLTNLKELDLGVNQITSIPESIGLLTNLKELNLYDNKITNIPKSIKNKQYLKL